MKKSVSLPLAALVAVAAIVGCGSYQTATTVGQATPAPTPSVACTLPAGTTRLALVYPPPGASPGPSSSPVIAQTAPPSPLPTNSLGGTDVVIAAAPAPLPTSWYTYLLGQQAPTTPAFGATFTTLSSPAPSGAVDPLFASETLQYSPNNGQVAPLNGWVVYVANPNCYPGIAVGAFGS